MYKASFGSNRFRLYNLRQDPVAQQSNLGPTALKTCDLISRPPSDLREKLGGVTLLSNIQIKVQ